MHGFHHATILSPSFHGVRKECLAQWSTPHFWPKNNKNAWMGTSRKIGWWCAALFLKPLPYLRPKSVIFPTLFQTWSKIWYPISAPEPGAWPECVTSCYGTYTVVGVNIKREMVLSPNDKEVANSSKKHYPIQDSSAQTITYFRPKWSKLIPYFRPKRLKKHALWHPTYPYSLYKGLPLGRKTRCRLLVSLLTQARLIST